MSHILIYNARIYTSEGYFSWMTIEHGKIKDMGTDGPDLSLADNALDMQQKLLLPGLHDSHLHVFGLGKLETMLSLKNTGSIAEVQVKLKEYAEKRPNDEWLIGYAWDQDYFEDKRYITREDIDLAVKDRPVFLYRGCNHIVALNSKALELSGIDKNTPDPEGGLIDRDVNGEPTGILREEAIPLAKKLIDITDRQQRKEYLRKGLEACLRSGLVSVQTNDRDAWGLYKELQEEDNLPIRVHLTIYHDEIGLDGSPRPGEQIGNLSCDRVKLFADGSLGGQTAYLRTNYADVPHAGLPIYSQEDLNAKVKYAKEMGYRAEVHCIGDKATEMTLDAFEEAGLTPEDRPIIIHAQILGKDLIERMQKMGVIASIQPIFINTDGAWVDTRIGDDSERRQYSYAWKTLLNKGVLTAGGSDAPIETQQPLYGLHASIFREDLRGNVFRPEEKLDFAQSVGIFTSGAAYVLKKEDSLGKLKVGYDADFIVVDQDVDQHPEKLIEAKVEQVWVSGTRKFPFA